MPANWLGFDLGKAIKDGQSAANLSTRNLLNQQALMARQQQIGQQKRAQGAQAQTRGIQSQMLQGQGDQAALMAQFQQIDPQGSMEFAQQLRGLKSEELAGVQAVTRQAVVGLAAIGQMQPGPEQQAMYQQFVGSMPPDLRSKMSPEYNPADGDRMMTMARGYDGLASDRKREMDFDDYKRQENFKAGLDKTKSYKLTASDQSALEKRATRAISDKALPGGVSLIQMGLGDKFANDPKLQQEVQIAVTKCSTGSGSYGGTSECMDQWVNDNRGRIVAEIKKANSLPGAPASGPTAPAGFDTKRYYR